MLLRLLVTGILCLLSFFAFSKTTTAITNFGNWTSAGTWDNGVPTSGDIINIPAGITVIINSTVNLRGGSTTTISVDGVLSFMDLGILRLNDNDGDTVDVLTGGSLIAGNALGGSIAFGTISYFNYAPFVFINDYVGFPSSGPIDGPIQVVAGVLPVTLLSFNATVVANQVELTWSTASEVDNDYFTVERSLDGEVFESIITRKGAGTTNETHNYKAIDLNPVIGRSYYRLKQADFDGKSTYSDLVTIDYEGPVFATLSAFPNPSVGNTLTLNLKGIRNAGEIPFQIVSIQGVVVYNGIFQVDQTGKATKEIEFQAPLSSGLYIIKAGRSLFLTQKVAVIH